MILRKRPKQCCIRTITFYRVDSIGQIADAATGRFERLRNPIISWIMSSNS
jgi:hypothetical protein